MDGTCPTPYPAPACEIVTDLRTPCHPSPGRPGRRRARPMNGTSSFVRAMERTWFAPAFPEGVDELCFSAPGIIKDMDLLKALFALFAEALHQLCRIGSAYETDPHVTLPPTL